MNGTLPLQVYELSEEHSHYLSRNVTLPLQVYELAKEHCHYLRRNDSFVNNDNVPYSMEHIIRHRNAAIHQHQI